jgi:AcrR family transcriptional regulator
MDTIERRLLDTAGQIFAEKGFEATTIREICKRADVQNIAAVNYYFRDKENLYISVVKEAFQGDAKTQPPTWPEGTPPADKLRDFIRRFAEGLIGEDRPAWHFQIMGRELSQPSTACEAFVRDFAQPHFQTLRSILHECLPELKDDQKRNLTALSIIGQIIHHRCARKIISRLVGDEEASRYTASTIGEHIADFSLAALGLESTAEAKS